jgi:hypothetical protein
VAAFRQSTIFCGAKESPKFQQLAAFSDPTS